MNYSIRPLLTPASRPLHTVFQRFGLITVLSTSILGGGVAHADRPATFWVGEPEESEDFFDFSNWSLGSPGSNLDARIDNDGIATISTESFVSIPYVFLGSEQRTSGTLEIVSGGIAKFTTMVVGALNATGTLNIREGGQLTSFGGPIGSDYLGVGVATITGAGSIWNLSGSEMVVGGNGTGTLRLEEDGIFNVRGGMGRVQLANHPVSEGNIYFGDGGAAGTLNAAEIYNGQGRATVIFNHNEEAFVFGSKFTGINSVNGYLNLRQEGSGTTILSAPESNLAGIVTVAAGTLLVNGSILGSTTDVNVEDEVFQERTVGKFEVLDGGILGGTGFIEGATKVMGTLSPGVGVGILRFGGDLSLLVEPDPADPNAPFGKGTVKIEIGGTLRGVEFDGVDVAGTLIYAGTLNIVLLDGFLPEDGATFDLFNGFESYEGTFDNIVFSSEGYAGDFDPQSGILSVSTVPEPSVLGLAVVGMAALGLRRRRALKSHAI